MLNLNSYRAISKTMLFSTILIFVFQPLTSNTVMAGSPYDSGRDHGCDDARISDPSDRYINQPEKGPSFHTSEFMNGYDSGFSSCSSSNSNNDNSPNYESSSSRSSNVDPEECRSNWNDAGEFASDLGIVPGGKIIGKFAGNLAC